jgi:His/Glu/Gln/Arg/opine family amino acid ABC transporter permease subunit
MDLVFMFDVLVRLIPPLGLTITLSLTALTIATPIGLGLGTLRATLRDGSFTARILDSYVFLVRGTPILIQIFAVYFLLPLTGLKLPLFWMGILALVFNSAGYQIEIARAAVNSVPKGQWEAAAAIGFNRSQSLLTFILPQAARRMAGPVMNELSQLIKASSVLSVITLYELHKAAEAIISANFRFVEVLIVEGFWYFIFVYTLVLIAQHVEGRFSASGGLAEQR